MKLINRRQFFKVGSAAALSSAMLPKWLRGNDCDLTTLDIVGPFYIPDSPSRTVLASPEEPGVRLFISGTIFANDCTVLIRSAIPEIPIMMNLISGDRWFLIVRESMDSKPLNLDGIW